MPRFSEASDTDHAPASARWPTIILSVVLVGGMCAAAWQSARRGVHTGPRDLTVLAPEGATLTLDGASSRIPVVQGVHAFSVTPGEHALKVDQATGSDLEHNLNVPLGIGPLMIELQPGEDGQLEIGFY